MKEDKYFRYTYPHVVLSALVKEAKAVVLITRDEEDVVKRVQWLPKPRDIIQEFHGSPAHGHWSLQRSLAFLNRFLALVHHVMGTGAGVQVPERRVVSFFRSHDKKEVGFKILDYDCDDLTGGDDSNTSGDKGTDPRVEE